MIGNPTTKYKNVLKYLELSKEIKFDVGEFGLFQGATFSKILPIVKNQGKILYGFDSFCGLDEPSEFDSKKHYPKGKFNTKGEDKLVTKLEEKGYIRDKDYFLCKGYIKDTLNKFAKEIKFSFAYVDLDHYEPTKLVLNWLIDRTVSNSIILCDDYLSHHKTGSTLAIKQFLLNNDGFTSEVLPGNQIVLFRK